MIILSFKAVCKKKKQTSKTVQGKLVILQSIGISYEIKLVTYNYD